MTWPPRVLPRLQNVGITAPDCTADEIIAALRAHGITLSALALELGVERRELGMALKPCSDDYYRSVIASKLGYSVADLWPSLYWHNGREAFRLSKLRCDHPGDLPFLLDARSRRSDSA